MLIVLDHHSGIPVYRQLMDQIKFHVASGLLNSGDELPSTRSLSTRLGLNPMTVSKAYGLLERERVLDRRPGLPLVVRPLASEDLKGDVRQAVLGVPLEGGFVTVVPNETMLHGGPLGRLQSTDRYKWIRVLAISAHERGTNQPDLAADL